MISLDLEQPSQLNGGDSQVYLESIAVSAIVLMYHREDGGMVAIHADLSEGLFWIMFEINLKCELQFQAI